MRIAMARKLIAAAAAALLLTPAACTADPAGDGLKVVVSTEILADLVRHISGDKATVDTVVPPGGDPHSYEPTPADAAKVARADVAFTNHLLLEEHALIKLFDTNMRTGLPNVSIAEKAEQYGATLIPLVENINLDVLWLGLAVRGKTQAARSADVRLAATALDGPGHLFMYVTGALGQPQVYVNTADGFDAKDVAILPPGAHTHLNWAFTKAGMYKLTLAASLDAGTGGAQTPLGSAVFSFAVGVDPQTVAVPGQRHVLNEGHADVSVSLETGKLVPCVAKLSCAEEAIDLAPENTVFEVPNKAVALVPEDPRFAFLGKPGTQIWELPQAVLGKHVHGQIDPHLWQAVGNTKAYVQVMTDTIVAADSANADFYRANRDRYLAELSTLDSYVRDTIAKIPAGARQLITTHDAFGYLAKAYGMTVAGFVVPNPAQEPSAAQVAALTAAIKNLGVRAVFVEPNLHARAGVLRQVATDHGVRICTLYGDAFDPKVNNYVDMMRHNADELLRCLGGSS